MGRTVIEGFIVGGETQVKCENGKGAFTVLLPAESRSSDCPVTFPKISNPGWQRDDPRGASAFEYVLY